MSFRSWEGGQGQGVAGEGEGECEWEGGSLGRASSGVSSSVRNPLQVSQSYSYASPTPLQVDPEHRAAPLLQPPAAGIPAAPCAPIGAWLPLPSMPPPAPEPQMATVAAVSPVAVPTPGLQSMSQLGPCRIGGGWGRERNKYAFFTCSVVRKYTFTASSQLCNGVSSLEAARQQEQMCAKAKQP